MKEQYTDFHDDLNRLSDFLGTGNQEGWPHELRKNILLLLHRLKNISRKSSNSKVESELVAIESSLGFGSGSFKEPDSSIIDEHQFHLLEFIEIETEVEIRQKQDHDENPESILVEVEDEEPISNVTTKTITETNNAKIQLVISNCPGRDAARELARGLVNARLAACVNVIANIGAIYWWQGEIKDTAECQLQIKTSNQSLEDVMQYINQHHPDEVPEILAISVEQGNEEYFDWVKKETYDRE